MYLPSVSHGGDGAGAGGGAFDVQFAFNARRNKHDMKMDKFYVSDVVNMIDSNQKYTQQHLQQLAKLYLKQVH